jgi:hypothetical protein
MGRYKYHEILIEVNKRNNNSPQNKLQQHQTNTDVATMRSNICILINLNTPKC